MIATVPRWFHFSQCHSIKSRAIPKINREIKESILLVFFYMECSQRIAFLGQIATEFIQVNGLIQEYFRLHVT